MYGYSLVTGLLLAFHFSALILPALSIPLEGLADMELSRELSRSKRATSSFFPRSSRLFPRKLLSRLVRPSLVSETATTGEMSEAVVEFKPATITFQNLTRAMLNLTLLEQDSSLTSPITFLASVGSSPSGPSLNLGTLQPTEGQATMALDVLPFIQSLSLNGWGLTGDNASSQTTPTVRNQVRLVFEVRRECNSVERSECPPILDILTRVPFLFFNYDHNTEHWDNVDQLLAMKGR